FVGTRRLAYGRGSVSLRITGKCRAAAERSPCAWLVAVRCWGAVMQNKGGREEVPPPHVAGEDKRSADRVPGLSRPVAHRAAGAVPAAGFPNSPLAFRLHHADGIIPLAGCLRQNIR